MMTRYRRDLRCTIADFSVGRNPRYEIDTFATPEGTLGIKLFPKVQLGTKPKEITNTNRSTNIYWFCKHLEESGWLVKECFIGEEPPKPQKIQLRPTNSANALASGTTMVSFSLYTTAFQTCVYLIVRKIDDTDIDTTPKKRKK